MMLAPLQSKRGEERLPGKLYFRYVYLDSTIATLCEASARNALDAVLALDEEEEQEVPATTIELRARMSLHHCAVQEGLHAYMPSLAANVIPSVGGY
eukprot:6302517-Amphidinium_carterae.3